jgi:hypothetical protein
LEIELRVERRSTPYFSVTYSHMVTTAVRIIADRLIGVPVFLWRMALIVSGIVETANRMLANTPKREIIGHHIH